MKTKWKQLLFRVFIFLPLIYLYFETYLSIPFLVITKVFLFHFLYTIAQLNWPENHYFKRIDYNLSTTLGVIFSYTRCQKNILLMKLLSSLTQQWCGAVRWLWSAGASHWSWWRKVAQRTRIPLPTPQRPPVAYPWTRSLRRTHTICRHGATPASTRCRRRPAPPDLLPVRLVT